LYKSLFVNIFSLPTAVLSGRRLKDGSAKLRNSVDACGNGLMVLAARAGLIRHSVNGLQKRLPGDFITAKYSGLIHRIRLLAQFMERYSAEV
jgi:hypothetical protein